MALYIIWGLIPISLLLMTLYALYKKVFKRPGREYVSDYFKQVLYSSLGLAVAILFERTVFEGLFMSIIPDENIMMAFRWMIYPAVLLVGAYVIPTPKTKKVIPRSHHMA